MKVKKLIEILKGCDPEFEIYVEDSEIPVGCVYVKMREYRVDLSEDPD